MMSEESAAGNELGGEAARTAGPEIFDAVLRFWRTPFRPGALSAKDKELVALAVHSAASTLNAPGIARHVERARELGASDAEIADVLVSISPLGVHTFSMAVPALLSEMKALGRDADAELPPMGEEMRRIKEDFIRERGYWTEQREMLACLVPEFFRAYMALSFEPWRSGVLGPKLRELMYIAIDCSITHMYEHGLRIHIRNAVRHGATRDEILEVFEIAAVLGADTYRAGMAALAATKGTGG
jgi:alkylhydroperoxidase/carboxymuconolactone decarboxylase family protein YurZ